MSTRLVRVLVEGGLGGCAAGHVAEVSPAVARQWCDGVRAEYVDDDVERAVTPGAETRLAAGGRLPQEFDPRRTRTRGGRQR
jgi:hypothetical protein